MQSSCNWCYTIYMRWLFWTWYHLVPCMWCIIALHQRQISFVSLPSEIQLVFRLLMQIKHFRLWPICHYCICLFPLVVLFPEMLKLFSVKIFWLQSYIMKVILETRRLNKIDTYNCLRTSDCSQGLNHRCAQRIPGWHANSVFPIDGGVMLCVMS